MTTSTKLTYRHGDFRANLAAITISLVLILSRAVSIGAEASENSLLCGVNWSPAGPATNTSPTDPNNADIRRPEFGAWYEIDIPLMKGMNVNVVRTFIDLGVDETLGPIGLDILDEFQANGISVVMTVDDGINDLDRIAAAVEYYKHHPAVLMWMIGSEWNINRYFGVASSIDDAASRTETAAALIKSLDPTRLVATSYGDITIGNTETYVNSTCPSVDLWALNIYRGATFGAVFAEWDAMTDKPMIIGEFGVDAYNIYDQSVNESDQADWNLFLWNDLLRNRPEANSESQVYWGGFAFNFSDEWWKVPPYDTQGLGFWWSDAFPDVQGNEEWFGFVDINRKPRAVYYVFAMAFDPAYTPPPVAVKWQADSAGANANGPWIPGLGFARFRRNGSSIYYRTGGGGGGRGFNVLEADPVTGETISIRHFDTWSSQGPAERAMVDYLNSVQDGRLLAMTVGDEAGITFSNSCSHGTADYIVDLEQTLAALGSTKIQNYCFRGSWAMMTIKGKGVALAEGVSGNRPITLDVNIPLTCAGDVNVDGIVGVTDLLSVLAEWGPCPTQGPCAADIVFDRVINIQDLLVLLSAWGPCN